MLLGGAVGGILDLLRGFGAMMRSSSLTEQSD